VRSIPTVADETFSVRLPRSVAAEVRDMAGAENNNTSSVIRRLLSRAFQSLSDAERF
jgi:hypothetical protein